MNIQLYLLVWIRIVNNAIPDGPVNYSGSDTSVGVTICIENRMKSLTVGLTTAVSNIDRDVSNEENMEGSNIVVYGVVCMLEDVCKLEKFDVPFEVVRP